MERNITLIVVVVVLFGVGLAMLKDSTSQSSGGGVPGLAIINPPDITNPPESLYIPLPIFNPIGPARPGPGEQWCTAYEPGMTGGILYCVYNVTANSEYTQVESGGFNATNCHYWCSEKLASHSRNPGDCPDGCKSSDLTCPAAVIILPKDQGAHTGWTHAESEKDCQRIAEEECPDEATVENKLVCVKE